MIKGALRLVACDARALKLGLAPDLSLADARARIPDLVVENADAAADARLLMRLAASCERFTPLVALDRPAGLILDITGCAHLFGGQRALVARVIDHVRGFGIAVAASLASTPDCARALARFGKGGVVPLGEEAAWAGHLPVEALEEGDEINIALRRAGLTTLGELAARPPKVLAARFGEALTRTLSRIMGAQDRRITPLRALPDCMVERHFPEAFLDQDGLIRALDALIAEGCALLERRGEGGRLFEASFFRTDGLVRRIAMDTGAPSRNKPSLLRLLRLKLDTLADPLDPGFGFDAIRFAIVRTEPLTEHQVDFDGAGAEDLALADLLDRLVARLGRERVLRCIARDTHDPARAATFVPVDASAPKLWPASQSDDAPDRPVRLFDPPQPIETVAEVPDAPPRRFFWRRVKHEIVRAEGPERIAPEWWRDARDSPTRDYFRIEDSQGRRFWVFREGSARAGDNASALVSARPVCVMFYAELATTTNFSFLRGASSPGDLLLQALLLDHSGIGIADRNSLAGVVRAYSMLKDLREMGVPPPRKWREGSDPGEFVFEEREPTDLDAALLGERAKAFRLVTGTRLVFMDGTPDILAYPQNRAGWGRLCRLLTLGNRRAKKGECHLALDDLLANPADLLLIVMPGRDLALLATLLPRICSAAPGALWLGACMPRAGRRPPPACAPEECGGASQHSSHRA